MLEASETNQSVVSATVISTTPPEQSRWRPASRQDFRSRSPDLACTFLEPVVEGSAPQALDAVAFMLYTKIGRLSSS